MHSKEVFLETKQESSSIVQSSLPGCFEDGSVVTWGPSCSALSTEQKPAWIEASNIPLSTQASAQSGKRDLGQNQIIPAIKLVCDKTV